jgi:outer membrane receptor protein involved in Fe transport
VLVGGNLLTSNRGLDPPSVTPILHDKMSELNGFAIAKYELDANHSWELIGLATHDRFQVPIDPSLQPLSEAPAGAIRGTDSYGNPSPPFVPYDANPMDIEQNLFVAASYRFSNKTEGLQITPFFRQSLGDLSCDPQDSLGATADPGSTCGDVRTEVLSGGLSTRYRHAIGSQHHLAMGLDAALDKAHTRYASYTRDDASPAGGPDPSLTVAGEDTSDTLKLGVFAQDTISMGRFTVLPGVRIDAQNTVYEGGSEPSLFLVGPSARVGFSYAPSDDILLHAFVGYLWQAPNTIDAPMAARVIVPSLAGQSLPVDLKAERDWSAEVGISGRLLRKMLWGATAWGRYATDQIDRVNVGTTSLMASYNFARGRAAGAELWAQGALFSVLDAFANVSVQIAQGQGIDSAKYLFSPNDLANQSWVMLDHVQTWTFNVGVDAHDEKRTMHASVLVKYGSGLRTGADSAMTVPEHTVVDVSLRDRLDLPLHPELAVDVFNVFNETYAYRLGGGYIGSAYAPLRTINVRLIVPVGN